MREHSFIPSDISRTSLRGCTECGENLQHNKKKRDKTFQRYSKTVFRQTRPLHKHAQTEARQKGYCVCHGVAQLLLAHKVLEKRTKRNRKQFKETISNKNGEQKFANVTRVVGQTTVFAFLVLSTANAELLWTSPKVGRNLHAITFMTFQQRRNTVHVRLRQRDNLIVTHWGRCVLSTANYSLLDVHL